MPLISQIIRPGDQNCWFGPSLTPHSRLFEIWRVQSFNQISFHPTWLYLYAPSIPNYITVFYFHYSPRPKDRRSFDIQMSPGQLGSWKLDGSCRDPSALHSRPCDAYYIYFAVFSLPKCHLHHSAKCISIKFCDLGKTFTLSHTLRLAVAEVPRTRRFQHLPNRIICGFPWCI